MELLSPKKQDTFWAALVPFGPQARPWAALLPHVGPRAAPLSALARPIPRPFFSKPAPRYSRALEVTKVSLFTVIPLLDGDICAVEVTKVSLFTVIPLLGGDIRALAGSYQKIMFGVDAGIIRFSCDFKRLRYVVAISNVYYMLL